VNAGSGQTDCIRGQYYYDESIALGHRP